MMFVEDGMAEWWEMVLVCPKCSARFMADNAKYCPECGQQAEAVVECPRLGEDV